MGTPIGEWKILLPTLTPKKLWNASKILGSYLLSRLTGKLFHWGMPISIGIEPTTGCNLRCPQCPSGLRIFSRPTGMLEPQLFQALLDEIGDELVYLILYFQGEPYLNVNFLAMVSYAVNKNIFTSTSTNAHFLSPEMAQKTVESGLHKIIISIDGTTQETYQKYRVGGNL
ncbi:MAG: radical SAM protein, partial [Bacteroidia bacterium]|nr:radical SAM protein [Bacteroidia bacterium]